MAANVLIAHSFELSKSFLKRIIFRVGSFDPRVRVANDADANPALVRATLRRKVESVVTTAVCELADFTITRGKSGPATARVVTTIGKITVVCWMPVVNSTKLTLVIGNDQLDVFSDHFRQFLGARYDGRAKNLSPSMFTRSLVPWDSSEDSASSTTEEEPNVSLQREMEFNSRLDASSSSGEESSVEDAVLLEDDFLGQQSKKVLRFQDPPVHKSAAEADVKRVDGQQVVIRSSKQDGNGDVGELASANVIANHEAASSSEPSPIAGSSVSRSAAGPIRCSRVRFAAEFGREDGMVSESNSNRRIRNFKRLTRKGRTGARNESPK